MAFVPAAAGALGLRAPAAAALGVAARRVAPALRPRRVSMAAAADEGDAKDDAGDAKAQPPARRDRGNMMARRRRGWSPLWGLAPLRPASSLIGEMEAMLDSPFFRGSGGLWAGAGWPSMNGMADWAPRADLAVSADGKEYEWMVELPGMSKDDVSLSVDGDMLTVSGEKKSKRDVGAGTEMMWGKFQRSVMCPSDGDVSDKSKVRAVAKDGVLTVSFPKTSPPEGEATKEDNTIPISSE